MNKASFFNELGKHNLGASYFIWENKYADVLLGDIHATDIDVSSYTLISRKRCCNLHYNLLLFQGVTGD